MEELMDLIVEYFENTHKKLSSDELRKILKIKGEEQTNIFNSALNVLVENGSLFFDDKKRYRLFTNDIGLAYGEIQINKSGTGFVHTKDGYTILIENSDLKGALDGDKVIVNSIIKTKRDYFKGEVYKVLKRKTGNVVLEVIGDGMSASLIPHSNIENINVIINKNQLKNLYDGQIVLAKVGTEYIEGAYKAEIDKIIGNLDDPEVDIKAVFHKYGVPIDFSEEAREELKSIPECVREEDLKDVTDLRHLNILTIDCDNTKDRDDALYGEKLENGNYKLFVNIARPNYYVKKGSHLYKEVFEKGNSYYPSNSCNPMLPDKLSNGICSLNKDVDRLTKTVEIEINPSGEFVDIKIYNSVINSRMAMKYSEVNKIYKNEKVPEYEEFSDILFTLKKISDIYEKNKVKRNYLDFDIANIKESQDSNKKTIDFYFDSNGESGKVIENCMLIADKAFLMFYSWLELIYRVQESPDQKHMMEIIDIIKKSGYNIPKPKNITPGYLCNILNKLNAIDKQRILSSLLLRGTKRARYDTVNTGHFALQEKEHGHFTAPIRRITDFENFELIDQVEHKDFDFDRLPELEKELKQVAERANKTEVIAEKVEEEVRLIKMAGYMQDRIGEEFDAYVYDISTHSMFARTENLIVGKIRLDDISGDTFYFDENKHCIIGRNSKIQYRIGDKIKIIVKDASKANQTINFKIDNSKVKVLKK